MSTKFSLQRRPLFPPPVCKKVPPYPPMPDIPPNAIIVQIIGRWSDQLGTQYHDCGTFWVYGALPGTWSAIIDNPLDYFYFATLDFNWFGKTFSFDIERHVPIIAPIVMQTGTLQIPTGNPFHAGPADMLPPTCSGSLTVELSSA